MDELSFPFLTIVGPSAPPCSKPSRRHYLCVQDLWAVGRGKWESHYSHTGADWWNMKDGWWNKGIKFAGPILPCDQDVFRVLWRWWDKWLSKWRGKKWANPPQRETKPREVFHTIGSSSEISFFLNTIHTHTLCSGLGNPTQNHTHTHDEKDYTKRCERANLSGQLLHFISTVLTFQLDRNLTRF